jgi:hypothetical protein
MTNNDGLREDQETDAATSGDSTEDEPRSQDAPSPTHQEGDEEATEATGAHPPGPHRDPDPG